MLYEITHKREKKKKINTAYEIDGEKVILQPVIKTRKINAIV